MNSPRRGWKVAAWCLASLLGAGLRPAGVWAAEGLTYGSLKFEENDFDFGEVFRGSEQSHRFKFTNLGPGPLTIQGVHAACGCTVAQVEKGRTYQPGEGGQVDIRLDTTNFAGPLVKTVTVMSNEALLPDRTLTLKARIKSEVEAIPPLFDFGDVRPASGATRTVRIRAVTAPKLVVEDLVYNKELFAAELVQEKDDWLITLKLSPKVAPGFLKEQVSVRNSSLHLRSLPLPVRANVLGNIDFKPDYLEFGAIGQGEVAKRSVTLRGTLPFELTGSRVDLLINGTRLADSAPLIKVETTRKGKDEQIVAIDLKNTAKTVGSVHGKVYLQTTDPTQREILFDFYAFFR